MRTREKKNLWAKYRQELQEHSNNPPEEVGVLIENENEEIAQANEAKNLQAQLARAIHPDDVRELKSKLGDVESAKDAARNRKEAASLVCEKWERRKTFLREQIKSIELDLAGLTVISRATPSQFESDYPDRLRYRQAMTDECVRQIFALKMELRRGYEDDDGRVVCQSVKMDERNRLRGQLEALEKKLIELEKAEDQLRGEL